MLKRLLSFGLQDALFNYRTVKEIEKSFMNDCEMEVIDYDETKRKIIERINASPHWTFNEPKSCDGLLILPDINRIDFIEFKSLKSFLIRLNSEEDIAKQQIDTQVEKFDFSKKIVDSVYILRLILDNGIFLMSKKELEEFVRTEKKYVIVIDIDFDSNPIESFMISLEYASQFSSSNYLQNKIITTLGEDISVFGGIRIEKPLIMNKEKFESFYEELIIA